MKNIKFVMPLLFFILATKAGEKEINVSSVLSFADPVATHNMLVVGEKSIFLSHLPMFPESAADIMPHRYQAIFEVGLDKTNAHPDSIYMKDRLAHPAVKIYTINPEPFVLPVMVKAATAGAGQKFSAGIFRGHLEKDGTRILSGINVSVKRVVYFQQFDPAAKRPAQLEYLLFGKGKELFLAHLITRPPDFDQVISVAVTGHSFTDEELAQGIKLVITASKNTSAKRLMEKQHAAAVFTAANHSTPVKIQLTVAREFYFEEGELRVPANFNTTAEEKKAGFQ